MRGRCPDVQALRPGGESRVFYILAATAVLVLIVAFLVLRPGPPESAIDRTQPRETESSTTPEPEARERTSRDAASGDADSSQTSFPGLGTQLGGLQGKGSNSSLEPHRLTVRLSSSGPVGHVVYIIPTSKNDRGSTLVTASSWSLTTTVYGPPDYAAVFGQGAHDGRAVTCEITVDGKVTERRTTKGPYGAMWCVG